MVVRLIGLWLVVVWPLLGLLLVFALEQLVELDLVEILELL
jgi:hypothetical protein